MGKIAKFFWLFLYFSSIHAMEPQNKIIGTDEDKKAFFAEMELNYATDLFYPVGFPKGSIDLFENQQWIDVLAPIVSFHYQSWVKDDPDLASSIILLSTQDEFNEENMREWVSGLSNLKTDLIIPLNPKFTPSHLFEKFEQEAVEYIIFKKTPRDSAYLNNTYIQYVEGVKGYGLFAKEDIDKNALIGCYHGSVFYDIEAPKKYLALKESKQEDISLGSEHRESCYLARLLSRHPHFFLMEGPRGDNENYCRLCIDGTIYRNEIAFSNHSPIRPNAQMRGAIVIKPKGSAGLSASFQMAFLSTQKIEKDCEILWNYNVVEEGVKKNWAIVDLCPYKNSCYYCNIKKDKLLKCARCKVAEYCSKACQMKDWANHKKICNH